ncbi:MAG: aromatic ring-hydroxylating dioxygenase subunit alpha, partial [Rhodobacteraceae bacterium]|nr:aromatic ring-hydroxylating dioxygenase subunit alpha [Paracoccaceae bacterium]
MVSKEHFVDMLQKRRPGYSLEQPFYTDPDIFDLDMEAIFYKEWLFAIPSCEVPKAGDYVTHKIGKYRVIIIRGQDGEIRAFHNTCRHRGSIICQELRGSAPKLVCPYHQWTYELDGRLLWARDMGDDFEPSKFGLHKVHCRDLGGLVYICLADEAPDIEPYAAIVRDYTGPHNLKDMKIAYESTIVEEGNWK